MAKPTPEQSYNLEELIEAGSDDLITYSNFSLLEKISNIEIPSENLIFDYMTELQSMAVSVLLTEAELQKYKYKPKLMAYDVYGSTECYFIIMALNNIVDVRDFNFKSLKMIEPEYLEDFMSYIYEANTSLLDANRDTI